MFKDTALSADLERNAVHKHLPAATFIMRAGDPITHIPIVTAGSLRILAQNNEGQERFLYHIMPAFQR